MVATAIRHTCGVLVDRIFDIGPTQGWCREHKRVCFAPTGVHYEAVRTEIRLIGWVPVTDHRSHKRSLAAAYLNCPDRCFLQLVASMQMSRSVHKQNAVAQWLRSHPEAAA